MKTKTKTMTGTYPDNFDEWTVHLNKNGEVVLSCPFETISHDISIKSLSIEDIRILVEAHNRSVHLTITEKDDRGTGYITTNPIHYSHNLDSYGNEV